MKSASMFPTLDSGDTVLVNGNVTPSQIYAAPLNASGGPGDIVVFNFSAVDELIICRAVAWLSNQTFLVTKGDGNPVPGPDSPTPITELTGKVLGYMRAFNAGTWNNVTYNVTVETNCTLYCPLPLGSYQPENYTGGGNFTFDPASKTVSFSTVGYISRATAGYCNVTIPKNLLSCDQLNGWRVKLNGTDTPYAATQNSTDTSIQFTYNQPTYEITITATTALQQPKTQNFQTQNWWPLLLIVAVITGLATATIITIAIKPRKRRKIEIMTISK